MSSEHGRTTALVINSEQLWSSDKTKSVNIPAWKGAGAHKCPPLPEELFTAGEMGGGRVSVLEGSWQSNHSP